MEQADSSTSKLDVDTCSLFYRTLRTKVSSKKKVYFN